jgi:phenylacetate-CoA ligase
MTKAIEQYIQSLPIYQQLYGERINHFCLQSSFQYPVLEKKHLIQAYPKGWYTPAFLKAESENQIVYFSTSGTTGEKIHVLGSNTFHYQEFYRMCYAFPQLRYPGGKRHAVLTTATCSALGCVNALESYSKRVQGPGKLSLNHLNNPYLWKKEDIERMRDEILRFHPDYLLVDPIYLAVFVLLAKRYRLSLSFPSLKLVVYTFEYAPRACLDLIKCAFQLPIYSAYGMSETGIIYVQTPSGTHRLIPNNVAVKFEPVDADKRLYELFVTATNNALMPLIHYRTGDLVVVEANSVNTLESHPNLVQIQAMAGRKNQCLLAKGRFVSVDELDSKLYALSSAIYVYRISQRLNDIEIIYATTDEKPMEEAKIASLKNTYEALFGLPALIQFARSITPTPSGKFLLSRRQT